MKRKRWIMFLVVSGLVLAVFGSITTGGAMQSVDSADGSTIYLPSILAQDTNGDVESFRTELEDHYDDLEALYPYIAEAATPGLLGRISDARESAARMSPEALDQIKEVFQQNPILSDGPKQLLAFFEAQEQAQAFKVRSLDSCPAFLPDTWCGCKPGVPDGMTGVYIAKGVAQGFEFATHFVPQDEVFGAVVLGEGVVSTIWAHPAKIVLHAAYETALSAALVVEGVYAVNDACHQSYHRALLVEHDDYVHWMLDNVVEHRKVHLQVIELVEKREFMVSATEAGNPLTAVEFTAVKFSTMDDPGTFIDVTANATVDMVEDGIYLVRLDMPVGDGSPRIYSFAVKHNNGFVDHFGFTMFDRIGPRNLGGGQ